MDAPANPTGGGVQQQGKGDRGGDRELVAVAQLNHGQRPQDDGPGTQHDGCRPTSRIAQQRDQSEGRERNQIGEGAIVSVGRAER